MIEKVSGNIVSCGRDAAWAMLIGPYLEYSMDVFEHSSFLHSLWAVALI